MSKNDNKIRMSRVMDCAEDFFNMPIERISAPGGEGRSSYRLHFKERTVIATLRPNFRRTHLEGFVLGKISEFCDDLPQCLGVVGEIMFQSDVGSRRLNVEIAKHDETTRIDLAEQAVSAIFRIQSAARKTTLGEMMPHLGNTEGWVMNFVDAVEALHPFANGISSNFDRIAAYEMVMHPGQQFVKWDCRSGNAAIGDDEKLRWFDFEYAGMRHGAEDFAWLIGDEAWPLAPETMLDIVTRSYDPDTGHTLDAYLEYLSVYVTFHCIQRFKLITKEAQKRGWLTKERVRKYDDAGVHPEFAAHLCETGRFFAERSRITAPLARNFEGARDMFLDILHESDGLKNDGRRTA